MSQIVHIEAAHRELAEAHSIEDVKVLRDKAGAIQSYLRQQGETLEIQNLAAELKLRAERKLGELLGEGGERRGGNSHGGSSAPLPDGVTHSQSHRWQRVASVPDDDFEQHVAKAKSHGGEITTAGVLKLAKALNAARPSDRAEAGETCTVDDLERLTSRDTRFGAIYADPPWQYGNQGTRAATSNHYVTMPFDEIAALPIDGLAAENSHLHLWCTSPFLREGVELVRAWGFEYKSSFVWVKPEMGIGNYWRLSHEFMLLGIRGKCPFRDHSLMSWMQASRSSGHSAKPHNVRGMIERASPGPYLELFGRQAAQGWTVWGNEVSRDLFTADVERLSA